MTKAELAAEMAKKSGLSVKDTELAINAFAETVTETLKAGDLVRIIGFGSFKTRERAATKAYNPATGAEIEVPARKIVSFSPGKGLRDEIQ